MTRDEVPAFVSKIVDGRPVRWIPTVRCIPALGLVGSVGSGERTLQVFNANAKDQRRLRETIAAHRGWLEKAAGGPLVIIFYSEKQSQERYSYFVDKFMNTQGDKA